MALKKTLDDVEASTLVAAVKAAAKLPKPPVAPQGTFFQVERDKVSRITTTEHHDAITQTLNPEEFWSSVASAPPFNSGLLPPGVISVRTGGTMTQLVMEIPPGVYTTIWGASEGDSKAQVYQLAMPWRYAIGVYHKTTLLGARLFYSPQRITHLQQHLCHANVPNLNCRGYSHDVSVGWLCLYHSSVSSPTLADKARYLVDRVSGGEPFNDGNMFDTDGARFYASMLQKLEITDHEFLCDPQAWQAKSEEEGFEWTLNPNLWIPVQVTDVDDQRKHDPNGPLLSLGMAMYGKAKFYYHDKWVPKVYDTVDRGLDWLGAGEDDFWTALSSGWQERVPVTELELTAFEVEHPTIGVVVDDAAQLEGQYNQSCAECGTGLPEDSAFWDEGNEQYFCEECWPYQPCPHCSKDVYPDEMRSLDKETALVLELKSDYSYCLECVAEFNDQVEELQAASEAEPEAIEKMEVKTA